MRTVLVRGWMPESITDIPSEELTEQFVKENCIRCGQYPTEGECLMSYAECRADWSTILDTEDDIEQFIDNASGNILRRNYDWLEEHFV